eukprot:TRINITY_DN19653_c0_g1_i1.p1 TRINITY_DN19653_c0_g1~~TRINITY_DN19653_c0_g1_i1.p1  ORF type:complete len:211 (+),score=81.49 TRINITY_DN19653_c0_g1_i1:82-633(+)
MAVFGCIQPGLPPCYQFQQVEPGKWMLPLGVLTTDQLVVFMTGAQAIPEGQGVALYLSKANDQSFEYLGCLRNDYPTGIFRIPVVFMELAVGAPLVLGLSLEPLDSLKNIDPEASKRQLEHKAVTYVQLAKKLVADLSEYLGSYTKRDPGLGIDVIYAPTNSLVKWGEKVATRLQRDPDWWSR